MVCEKCEKEFSEDYRIEKKGVPRFCSKQCANSRVISKEMKENLSKIFKVHPDKFCSCGAKIGYRNKTCKHCLNKNKIGTGKYGVISENNSDYNDARRRKIRTTLLERAGNKCSICGYDKYFGALEFHHLDETKKEFNLSHIGLNKSSKRIEEEFDKCVLLCSNCHREVHASLISL